MRDLLQAQVPPWARASRPRGPEHAGLQEPPPKVPGPQALPPQEDALVRQVEQLEPGLAPQACAQPLSPRLLLPRVRIPPRFRRPLHPEGDA